MKVLYLSCHSILEYDEVKLFSQMGLDVYSHGAYGDPASQGDGMRPPIPGYKADPKLVDLFRRVSKENLTEEFVEPFDVIVVMSMSRWIAENWPVIKKKKVIWRCIGQNDKHVEKMVRPYRDQGLKIVRSSPKEATIPGYAGQDALIRFYKSPEEYKNWTGENNFIINFTQSMKKRARTCNYPFFKQTTEGFPKKLFGPQNEAIEEEWAQGMLSFDECLSELRKNRVYFYTGTYPASYTLNFIEAWMTGIPVVALGPQRGNDPELAGYDLYEVSDLIKHGSDGFYSDDPIELRQIFTDLMRDRAYAKAIGEKGRKRATELFGVETIKKQWRDFFEKIN